MTSSDAESTVREALDALRMRGDLASHLQRIDDRVQLVFGSRIVATNRHEYATWMVWLLGDGVFEGGWDIDQVLANLGASARTGFVTMAFTELRP